MSSSATQRSDRKGGRGRLGHILSGLAVAIGCVLFLGGFVWGALLYQPFTVPTDSMQPAVAPGDRVLAQRIDGSEVHRGDVVVFQDPAWGDVAMVKRVIGVGGDKIACCDSEGRLTVNGTALNEPYLFGHGPASMVRFSATVPQDQLFLLGDNRSVSEDSRVHLADADHGAVPSSAVRARVDATVWPVSRMAQVARPSTFAALPGGVSRPGPVVWIGWAIAVGAVLVLGGAAYGPVAQRRSQRLARRRVPAEA